MLYKNNAHKAIINGNEYGNLFVPRVTTFVTAIRQMLENVVENVSDKPKIFIILPGCDMYDTISCLSPLRLHPDHWSQHTLSQTWAPRSEHGPQCNGHHSMSPHHYLSPLCHYIHSIHVPMSLAILSPIITITLHRVPRSKTGHHCLMSPLHVMCTHSMVTILMSPLCQRVTSSIVSITKIF